MFYSGLVGQIPHSLQKLKSLLKISAMTNFDNAMAFAEVSHNSTVSFCAGQKIVCYFTNWAQYRPGEGRFTPRDIDPSLCDCIIFAFAKLNGNKLASTEWNDEGPGGKWVRLPSFGAPLLLNYRLHMCSLKVLYTYDYFGRRLDLQHRQCTSHYPYVIKDNKATTHLQSKYDVKLCHILLLLWSLDCHIGFLSVMLSVLVCIYISSLSIIFYD